MLTGMRDEHLLTRPLFYARSGAYYYNIESTSNLTIEISRRYGYVWATKSYPDGRAFRLNIATDWLPINPMQSGNGYVFRANRNPVSSTICNSGRVEV